MAFQKSIAQRNTGISANYWRLGLVGIDPVAQAARLVLLGYVSAEIRQAAGGVAIDKREFDLTKAQFIALAGAAAVGATTYDVIGASCYGHIATAKRAVPVGAAFDTEARTLTIAETGEVIVEKDIDFDPSGNPMWIPSEFRDAVPV